MKKPIKLIILKFVQITTALLIARGVLFVLTYFSIIVYKTILWVWLFGILSILSYIYTSKNIKYTENVK